MTTDALVIEATAGDVAEVLRRSGVSPHERVTVTIQPAEELIPGRHASRAQVVAARLSDDDIDRLIKNAQRDVEPSA